MVLLDASPFLCCPVCDVTVVACFNPDPMASTSTLLKGGWFGRAQPHIDT